MDRPLPRSPHRPLHRKSSASAPSGYFAWEAAGLRWLAAAETEGGARAVRVVEIGDHHLDLVRLDPVPPTAESAADLGRALARTHLSGAPAYGSGPEGWAGDGWFGPLVHPLPLRLGVWDSWGAFYAEARIAPMVRLARDHGLYDDVATRTFDRLCSLLVTGLYDTDAVPARLHGDLWSGNVVWTGEGAVLVDPAAHGGHPETDLALLALFGAPHLDVIRAAYAEVSPRDAGWTDRVGLHQLHCLLVHAVVFGGGYVGQALQVARGLT